MTADLGLGLMLGYWGANPDDATDTVLAAEDVGFDSVWTAEAYGSDAFTPLTWYAARTTRIKLATGIVQLSARTPAATAMSAATLDALSGGRFTLGLGRVRAAGGRGLVRRAVPEAARAGPATTSTSCGRCGGARS